MTPFRDQRGPFAAARAGGIGRPPFDDEDDLAVAAVTVAAHAAAAGHTAVSLDTKAQFGDLDGVAVTTEPRR